jgi:hypothetical protein
MPAFCPSHVTVNPPHFRRDALGSPIAPDFLCQLEMTSDAL